MTRISLFAVIVLTCIIAIQQVQINHLKHDYNDAISLAFDGELVFPMANGTFFILNDEEHQCHDSNTPIEVRSSTRCSREVAK